MLIRVGANRGFNTDQVVHWTYTPAPEPEPEPEPTPTPPPEGGESLPETGLQPEPAPAVETSPYPHAPEASTTDVAASEDEPAPEGTATLTLVLTTGELTLEGEEADKLQAYLLSKTGAAV